MAHEEIVERYSTLARRAQAGETVADCGPGEFADGRFGAAGYERVDGLPVAAVQASLGCGNPVAVADLRPGETVLDLGSGGGIDVLLSARRVGPSGTAYGLDASSDMLDLARRNAAEAGATNVEFLHGTIEAIPLPDHRVDVVISNCVINLSDDKAAVLGEVFRVLRPGGRVGISDVVALDNADPQRRAAVEQRVGCTAGALTVTQYRELLLAAGFTNTTIDLTVDHGDGVHSAIIKSAKPMAPAGLVIRPMCDADADQVLTIYQYGLDTGHASFETTAPAWDRFSAGRLPRPRLVTADIATGEVAGWIAASPVSTRPVYAGVVEHSIYIHPGHQGRAIGRALLTAFMAACQDAGIWTIQTGIFPENTASLALHEALGFRTVGVRERIGRHHDTWRDVILLEHRNASV